MFQKVRSFLSWCLPEALSIRPVWVRLDSGLRICIDSRQTLEAFVELFIAQPYASALKLPEKLEFILDLGCNRGLFLLFMLHYMRKQGKVGPKFICVEAAKDNFDRLIDHVRVNSLEDTVLAVRGAVCGRRSGSVHFYSHPRAHGMGSIIVDGRWITTQSVPVINLAGIVSTVPRIDVLKMDIEGAEQAVLQEYPEVLEKTQVLVAEFHLSQIDYAQCRTILHKNGLLFQNRTFQYRDILCVETFSRYGVAP